MSDQQPSVAPAASTPEAPERKHAPHRFVTRGILWIPVHKSRSLVILSWFFAFIILWVGHAWATWSPDSVGTGIAIQLAMLVAFLAYEIAYTVYRNTAVMDLQIDVLGDLVSTFVLVLILGMRIKGHQLHWWYVVPVIETLADLLQSSVWGINNAADKPGVGPKLGT